MYLDVEKILSTAEGIYHQLISTPNLTDQIKIILGIPTVVNRDPVLDQSDESEPIMEPKELASTDLLNQSDGSQSNGKPEQEMEEVMYNIGLDFNF